jgi:hypothetical protein
MSWLAGAGAPCGRLSAGSGRVFGRTPSGDVVSDAPAKALCGATIRLDAIGRRPASASLGATVNAPIRMLEYV